MQRSKAEYRDKVAAISSKIANQHELARSLTQANESLRKQLSVQKEISLDFARDVVRLQKVLDRNLIRQEQAIKIINELTEEKKNLVERCILLQDEVSEALRGRVEETKATIRAYHDRNRCLDAVKEMKADMSRGITVLEGVRKENEELRACLEAYRSNAQV